MDPLTIIGAILGFTALLLGNFLDGGHLASLFNGPALVIVLGGTLGASLLQTPPATLRHALKMLVWIFQPPRFLIMDGIRQVISWSHKARREGFLGLERDVNMEADGFVKKGLQLLVDGNEPEVIRNIMEVELVVREQRDFEGAGFYEAMGGYAPTLGILGAVMGLIHVMQNLADPAMLGPGIAVAFVATIYGVAFANLLLLPIASKLKLSVSRRSQFREMIIEGITAIAAGENPRAIELKLQGFLEGRE